MGNPHCVIFTDNPGKISLDVEGPKIENLKIFLPRRTNVEFVKADSKHELTVRVWERGAGETLACGTGACAAVVAAVKEGLTANDVLVHLPGGNLEIEWELDDTGAGNGHILLRGPAETVYEGELALRSFSEGELK